MSDEDSPPPNVALEIEALIEEIRKRPMLWDRYSIEYNNRILKSKQWDEVHEAIFEDWKQISSSDRRIRAEEIKKKWRNMKDSYAKDLVIQKKARKGKIRQKRPYRYNNELSFLKGQFTARISKVSSDSSDDGEDYVPQRKTPKKEKSADTDTSDISINVATLIREVKSRPVLWNKQSQWTETSDRGTRDQYWHEICEIIFDNWADLGATAKSIRAVEVKKKWRNLRDSFGRELGRQRQVELGLCQPKKPYRFYNELSFLRGTLDKRYGNYPVQDHIEVEVASSNYSLESEFEDAFEPEPGKPETSSVAVKTYDEDVCFTEMLVPMLKRLNDDQKHYAQVKILNVLKRARQFDPLGTIERNSSRVIVKTEGSSP